MLFYYDAIFCDERLYGQYEAEIVQLLKKIRSSAPGLKPEKLSSFLDAQIYSIRLGKKARLLYKYEEVEGERHLIILEILPNHGYDKSRYLRCKKIADVAVVELAEEEEVSTIAAGGAGSASEEFEAKPVYIHQSKYILFSEVQKDAFSLKLPGLISGVPGTGKTAIALQMLYQKLQDFDLSASEVVYLSESDRLIKEVQKQWVASFGLEALERGQVLIMTVSDWLARRFPDKTGVGRDDCSHFIRETTNLLDKKTQKDEAKIAQIMRCLGERSGFDDDASYLGRTTSFSEKDDPVLKAQINRIYAQYSEHLIRESKVSSWLPQEKEGRERGPVPALIVLDEAQDGSFGLLRGLSNACEQNIVYMVGVHQSLSCTHSHYAYLKDGLFNRHLDSAEKTAPRSLSIVSLTHSYRSSPAVNRFCNGLLDLEARSVSSLKSERGVRLLSASESVPGSSAGFVVLEKVPPRLDESLAGPQGVVITEEAFKSEIPATFTVMTAEEAKGLEFDQVILWKPLTLGKGKKQSEMRSIHSLFNPEANGASSALMNDAKLRYFFNRLFVSASRAKMGLAIYEDDKGYNHFLYEAFKKYCFGEKPLSAVLSPEEKRLGWIQRVKQLSQMPGQESQCIRLIESHRLSPAGMNAKQYFDLLSFTGKEAGEKEALLLKAFNVWEEEKTKPIPQKGIAEQLQAKGLKGVEAGGDGNCLFHAVAYQLNLEGGRPYTHEDLRRMAVDQLLKDISDHHEDAEALAADVGDVADYILKMSTPTEWATGPIIAMMAKALSRPIRLINSHQDAETQIAVADPCGPPIVLGYIENVHFVGTLPLISAPVLTAVPVEVSVKEKKKTKKKKKKAKPEGGVAAKAPVSVEVSKPKVTDFKKQGALSALIKDPKNHGQVLQILFYYYLSQLQNW